MKSAKAIAMLCLLNAPVVDVTRKASSLRPRGSKAEPVVTPIADEESGEVVVHLKRVAAKNTYRGANHVETSFYVGNITVGSPPQEFQVLFDTSSGHVLLPHKACKKQVCLEHHRYSPWASTTAEDVNEDGKPVQPGHRIAKGKVNRSFASLEFTQSDLGDGIAKGVLVRDHVCLSSGPRSHPGHQQCTDLAMLAATDEDAMPFAAMPADGIIGLGLEGLAVSALSSFYARLMDSAHGMLPEFGVSLGATSGKIVFGGRTAINEMAGQLEWFPVIRPQEGLWQIDIVGVRVDGNLIDSCANSCHAVIDSSTSRLGVQEASTLESLVSSLASRHVKGACAGPELQFDLPRGMSITLTAADYANVECQAEIGPLNLTESRFSSVYSFGTNVMQRYDTAFDWANAQIGFAPTLGSPGYYALQKHRRSASAKEAKVLVF